MILTADRYGTVVPFLVRISSITPSPGFILVWIPTIVMIAQTPSVITAERERFINKPEGDRG